MQYGSGVWGTRWTDLGRSAIRVPRNMDDWPAKWARRSSCSTRHSNWLPAASPSYMPTLPQWEEDRARPSYEWSITLEFHLYFRLTRKTLPPSWLVGEQDAFHRYVVHVDATTSRAKERSRKMYSASMSDVGSTPRKRTSSRLHGLSDPPARGCLIL